MTQDWAGDIIKRVASEVRRLRDNSGVSGAKLSERTSNLGHSVSRSVIADLETGRKGTLEVADLIVLAKALGVAPVQLLYPDLPKGMVDVLPDWPQESHDALRWFSGEEPLKVSTTGWVDAASGKDVSMWRREQFDPGSDTVTITREWLLALKTMRTARSQLRTGLTDAEDAEHLAAMHDVYENARSRAAALFLQMTALQLNIGDGTSGG